MTNNLARYNGSGDISGNGANLSQPIQFGEVETGLKSNQRYAGAQAQEAARVDIEVGDGELYQFSLTLGSVTEADADAIAIPSNPWFGLGGGAVENALVRDMDKIAGAEPYAKAAPGTQFFERAAQQVKQYLGRATSGTRGKSRDGLAFGDAAAFPSGPMSQRGIDNVVLVNVLPEAARGEQLTAENVSLAVRNALRAAEYAGATSLAISEIGTGFMAAMGGSPFKTRQEAWVPILSGFTQYIEMARAGEAQGTVSRLSLAVYAGANEKNAQQVGEMLTGVVDAARSPQSQKERKVAALASAFHEDWRNTNQNPHEVNGATVYDPRVKVLIRTEDGQEKWVNAGKEPAGSTEIKRQDIANTPYDALDANWQAENKAAAAVVVDLLAELKGRIDLGDDEQVRRYVGQRIHDAWLSRNDWARGGELDVPFDQLPQAEQDKDINQMITALDVVYR